MAPIQKPSYGQFQRAFRWIGDSLGRTKPTAPVFKNAEEKARFELLMIFIRPNDPGAAGPGSTIGVDTIWNDVKTNFAGEVPPAAAAALDLALQDNVQDVLNPVLTYKTADLLFDIIDALEAKGKIVARHKDPNNCIFCGTTTAAFNAQEHALAESVFGFLRAEQGLLPQGWVCDPCNGRLGQVDNALREIPQIACNAQMCVLETKAGYPPRPAVFQGGKLWQRAPGVLRFDADPQIAAALANEPPTTLSLDITLRHLGEPSWSKTSRAAMKIGYELAALKKGRAFIQDARFQAARDFILGTSKTFEGVMLLERGENLDYVWLNFDENTGAFQLLAFGFYFWSSLLPNTPTPRGMNGVYGCQLDLKTSKLQKHPSANKGLKESRKEIALAELHLEKHGADWLVAPLPKRPSDRATTQTASSPPGSASATAPPSYR